MTRLQRPVVRGRRGVLPGRRILAGDGPRPVDLYWREYSQAPGVLPVGAERATVPRQRQSPDAAMDPAAFEQDALALVDRLYAAALRLTRNEADAQDLVQDTYLRAFRSSGQFEAGTNLRGWMFTILHNTFLNQRRDRGRSPIDADSEAVEQAPDDRQAAANPEELLLRETHGRRPPGGARQPAAGVPRGGLAAGRRAVQLRRDRRHRRRAHRDGDVEDLAGPEALYDDLVARSGVYAQAGRRRGESRARRV
ncbi:MAG: hypothetical protein M0C28_16530 [Candidatus Moduliflexus flocculans]|nr:hypothetical protein [Candidatus Moduliflexus flocculans]